jgi:hypothetical protein
MSDTVFQHIGRPVVTTAINDIPAEWAYTVPVLGVARGGTTMVATVLDRLGIYMGPRQELVGDHYENQAMKQPCWQTRADCVTNYNSKYARWGWKDTIGLPSFSELFPLIRSPRPVVVFRDIVASVQGNMRVDETTKLVPPRSFEFLLKDTMQQWNRLALLCLSPPCPILLVSYERAINRPEQFVSELADYLDVQITDDQMHNALSVISPTGGYLVEKEAESIDADT